MGRVRLVVHIYLPIRHIFTPRATPFVMSSPTSPSLQRLDQLDRSLSGFHDKLCEVLYGQEYIQCVPNLQDDDLVWLVDYLDKVRYRKTLCRSLFKPQQALDGLDLSSRGSRKCVRELRSICDTSAILPTSYTLSPDLLNIDPAPFIGGGYGEVHHGTLSGLRVCIKRMQVYALGGPKKATGVRY